MFEAVSGVATSPLPSRRNAARARKPLHERLGPGATVVTLMVDSGLKYVGTDVYRSGQDTGSRQSVGVPSGQP
jgi:hypothetical protein